MQNLVLGAVAICLLSLLFVLVVWLVRSLLFAGSMLFGAVFVPSNQKTISRMLALGTPKRSDRILDLGSGDGAILLALGKQGFRATGIEINPVLARQSKQAIRQHGLTKTVAVQRGSFWKEDLSAYSLVFLYGTTYIMKRLEKKLLSELKPGSRVVSNYFTFPNWKPKASRNNVHLYIVP